MHSGWVTLPEEQSTTSFSSIDGGLEPFPTADYHLTGYQDPPEDYKYTTGEQGSLSSGFPPPLSWNRYMLDEGVESRSDGVHRIHWKRIDSDGKVHFSIRERLRKFHSCCIRG